MAWSQEANIKGPKGDQGDKGDPGEPGEPGEGGGSGLLTGSGTPADALGSDGDFYIDTITGKIYGPKQPAGTPVPDTIAFRSQSTLPYAPRNDTIVPKPAGTAEGDILTCAIFLLRASGTPTDPVVPSGWTQVGTWTLGGKSGTNGKLGVFWKRAGASEPADYTWAQFENANTQTVMQAWTGCLETGSPVDVFSQNDADTGSTVATGITTTDATDMLLYFAHNWAGSGALSPPTGMTERFDEVAYAANQALTAAGATGNRTQATSAADPWAAFLVALKPGSVAGVVWPEAIDYATQAELTAGLATKAPITVVAASAPGSPVMGQLWFDTTTSSLTIWTGSAWTVITGTWA